MLKVYNLSVSVHGKMVIRDISFTLNPGSVTLCAGPNGSGKSSLACAIAGHSAYTIITGTVEWDGQDITHWTPDKRARAGLFLALQYPVGLPGISIKSLLQESFRALYPALSLEILEQRIAQALRLLQLDTSFLDRHVHDGFSGGQKKRCEMLQLLVLQPRVALLDEIDSGLDIDSVQVVNQALVWLKKECPDLALFLISHYQQLAEQIIPDQVMIIKEGALAAHADAQLLTTLYRGGYEQFTQP